MCPQPDDQARRTRTPVAAAKTQFVIKEQKIQQPQGFLAAQQTVGHLLIGFGALGFDINPMAKKIDEFKGIEFAIAFDVTRANKIGLMNVVNVEGVPKLEILETFWGVSSFFISPYNSEHPFDGAVGRHGRPTFVSFRLMAEEPVWA